MPLITNLIKLMEYYEIQKPCCSNLTINNHKHAQLNCEVLYFSKVNYVKPICGRVDRASATDTVDLGSIPSQVLVFTASLLDVGN